MKAASLVDLLLELNVIGTDDIDQKLRKIAARIRNPDARAWFMRVPRFFLINLDKQAETPYTLPQRANQYPAFQEEPGKHGGPAKTMLHKKDVEQEIDRTFEPYNPAKPPKKQIYKGPPAEVKDWMTAAKGRKEQLYFFDPYNRDQVSFDRLEAIANYLNFIPQDSPILKNLRTMRFDDIEGYRQVSQAAQEWNEEVTERPWKYRKMTGYTYGNFSVIAVNDVKTSMEMAKGTTLCVRMEGHAKSYLNQDFLYFVFNGKQLFACVHIPSDQVRDPGNQPLSVEADQQIAPLFKRINLEGVRERGYYGNEIKQLSDAVKRLPAGVEPTPIKNEKDDAEERATKVKRLLPPWEDDPPRDTGYRAGRWGESLLNYIVGTKI